MLAILRTVYKCGIMLRTEKRVLIMRHCKPLPHKPDPKSVNCDYVGPADPVSNIRPYVRHISKNETSLQKRLRDKQNEAEAWNHRFWSEHNKSFYARKEEYIKRHNLSDADDQFDDKISEFYREFLDENHKRHMKYNWEWYKKNFELLVLSYRVEIEKLFKKITIKAIKSKKS